MNSCVDILVLYTGGALVSQFGLVLEKGGFEMQDIYTRMTVVKVLAYGQGRVYFYIRESCRRRDETGSIFIFSWVKVL